MDNNDDDIEMQTLLASSKANENWSAFFSHSATRRELMEEALSELSFKPSMFFKTLLYEPFPFPIPMLICRLLENKHSARNRDFNNCMGPMFFWLWAGFLSMVLGLFHVSDETTAYTAITCIILTYSRAFTIAIKYAYYGKADIYGPHGMYTESYTHIDRMHQKLMCKSFNPYTLVSNSYKLTYFPQQSVHLRL